jgi:hypothetical protein
MAQFSVKIISLTGSVLGENQHVSTTLPSHIITLSSANLGIKNSLEV